MLLCWGVNSQLKKLFFGLRALSNLLATARKVLFVFYLSLHFVGWVILFPVTQKSNTIHIKVKSEQLFDNSPSWPGLSGFQVFESKI